MTKPASGWSILLPLMLLTQTAVLQAEDGSDYVINALRRDREARELQDKRDREAAVRTGNEQARQDGLAADSAQAHWEGQRQEQMAAENTAYYERIRRERDQAAWQAYRQQVGFKCPINRPPTFKDQASEFAYWQARSDRDPFAAWRLGYFYANGIGTAVDQDAAIAAFQKSNQNWVEVQSSLGYLLLADTRHRDPAQGLALLSGAAETGNIQAMFTLAACYHRGTGVAPDPVKTFMWLYACFVYPTTDGDPYLEPSYKMLGEEHEHIAAIFEAVTAELQHKVIRPWGSYNQKDVLRFVAASASHTSDPELWYHYALNFPADGENATIEVTLALCNAVRHGSSKALYHLLATPADVTEVYEPDPKALLAFNGLLAIQERSQFIDLLEELPPDPASATAIARICSGDLGGDADPAKASEWALKAAALGDHRPTLAISRAYRDGTKGWPYDVAEAAAWSARIPEPAWHSFHQQPKGADKRDQAVLDLLAKSFAIRWTFTPSGPSAIVDSVAPFARKDADKAAMDALFEQGFASEATDPRTALESYATAASGGNLNALIRIGLLAQDQTPAVPGHAWRVRWAAAVTQVLRQLADAGDANAAVALADDLAEQAKGPLPDEARRYFEIAADLGHPAAAAWVGVDRAIDHDGRKGDVPSATRLLRLATANAERWQSLSERYSLKASSYDRLQGTVADTLKALDDGAGQRVAVVASLPTVTAALTGLEAHLPAYEADRAERAAKQCELGRTFDFMDLPDSAPHQDLAKAFAAYTAAAAAGDGWAALEVANFFAHGRAGLAPDEALAKRWRTVGRILLEHAAPFDGDLAEDLGIALIDGPDAQKSETVPANEWLDRDVAAGIRVLQIAAVTSCPHAAAILGPLYNGDQYPAIGIPHDDKLYAAWNAISDQLLNEDDAKIRAEGLAAAKKLLAAAGVTVPDVPAATKTSSAPAP